MEFVLLIVSVINRVNSYKNLICSLKSELFVVFFEYGEEKSKQFFCYEECVSIIQIYFSSLLSLHFILSIYWNNK
jgi:hypothetical protein